jgi:hypothetical protein
MAALHFFGTPGRCLGSAALSGIGKVGHAAVSRTLFTEPGLSITNLTFFCIYGTVAGESLSPSSQPSFNVRKRTTAGAEYGVAPGCAFDAFTAGIM